MPIQEEIYELILAKLIHGLDKGQEECLQEWLSENEQNRNVYREICSLWYSGRWAYKRERIQKSRGWERIVEIKRGRKRKRVFKAWRVGVAASVVLVVGAFFLLRFMNGGDAEQFTESRQANVTLILASGERVDIGNRVDQTIQEVGSVIRSDSALLVYEKHEIDTLSEKIVYNELVVPKCGEYKLRLSDGSLVILNSGSKLRYPVNFSGDLREVFLCGEACFEVVKNPDKPFVVHTDRTDVQVLGTLFNVSAYSDEENTEVTLVNGRVQVGREEEPTVLLPGQQFLLNNQTLEKAIREVDTNVYIAWTNGLFRFDAMPLEQLMLKLSRWIPITYTFKDEAIKKIRFTGGFRKYDDVDHMLKMLEEIINISFKRKGREIIIDWYQN